MNLYAKWKQNNIHRKPTSHYKRRRKGEGQDRDMDTQTTVYKINKEQGYSTRNYSLYLVITFNGV